MVTEWSLYLCNDHFVTTFYGLNFVVFFVELDFVELSREPRNSLCLIKKFSWHQDKKCMDS